MLRLEDCLGLCDLTEDEVRAIAQHEHIPEIAAAELASYLVHAPGGEMCIKGIIRDDIAQAAARGDATETSDVDLLIVLESAARIERPLYDQWDRVLRSRGRRSDDQVSPQFAALPPSPEAAGGLWLEVAREGIVLHDRDGRLAKFLISLRDFVASGAATRKTVHGHPYWVRGGEPE